MVSGNETAFRAYAGYRGHRAELDGLSWALVFSVVAAEISCCVHHYIAAEFHWEFAWFCLIFSFAVVFNIQGVNCTPPPPFPHPPKKKPEQKTHSLPPPICSWLEWVRACLLSVCRVVWCEWLPFPGPLGRFRDLSAISGTSRPFPGPLGRIRDLSAVSGTSRPFPGPLGHFRDLSASVGSGRTRSSALLLVFLSPWSCSCLFLCCFAVNASGTAVWNRLHCPGLSVFRKSSRPLALCHGFQIPTKPHLPTTTYHSTYAPN